MTLVNPKGRVNYAPKRGTVVIPAGQQSANATLQGLAPGAATVTVSNPDYGTATSAVTVTAQLDVTVSSVSFAQGRTADVTIVLKSAGAEVAAVQLPQDRRIDRRGTSSP